jgi:anti-anti-sigma factor
VLDDTFPVLWTGSQAVVTLPDYIDVTAAGQVREQLLAILNRGADPLVVDMAATVSCDQAGADAIARAYQRAHVSGAQLRLVVAAPVVRRVLSLSGIDRLVSVYPSLDTALAAGGPGAGPASATGLAAAADQPSDGADAGTESWPGSGDVLTAAVLRQVVDALADGVALTDDDGVLVLVNRRMAEMFGYQPGELAGQHVEVLIPADLRSAHVRHRNAYSRAPRTRLMGSGERFVGLRKDGSSFPVEISLSPVPTATRHLTLSVVHDGSESRRREDLGDLARAAVAAGQAQRAHELLERVTTSIHQVGHSLQAAVDLPAEAARDRIGEALRRLDDTVGELRDHAVAFRNNRTRHPRTPPNGDDG